MLKESSPETKYGFKCIVRTDKLDVYFVHSKHVTAICRKELADLITAKHASIRLRMRRTL